MAAAARAVMPGRLGHDQAHFHRVAQADQAVAQLGAPVKGFDLVLQVAQFAYGAAQPFARAHQPHVMPHHVLDGLHIPLD